MFTYWQGYELDGSDTSYNLITPARELVLEVVRYYLGLKTIDKRAPLRVEIVRTASLSQPEHYSYFLPEEQKQLFTLLAAPDVASCSLCYTCIRPNSLLPSIRKKVTALVASLQESKDPPVHPVFLEDDALVSRLSLFFDNTLAQPALNRWSSLHKEQYTSPLLQTDYCLLELNLPLNGPFGIVAYNMQETALRFPELQIDVPAMLQAFYGPRVFLSGKRLHERVDFGLTPPEAVFNKLLEQKEFAFVIGWRWNIRQVLRRDELELVNTPRSLDNWIPGLAYRQVDAQGAPLPTSGREGADDPYMNILHAFTGGKRILPINDYPAFLEKLADAVYISDSEFTSLSTAWVQFQGDLEGRPEWHDLGAIKAVREPQGPCKGRPRLVLDIPQQLASKICRQYGF